MDNKIKQSPNENILKQEIQSEINDILKTAFIHFNNGNIVEAQRLYVGIIDIEPLHAEANHNLGIIEATTSSPISALSRLEIAIQANPNSDQYWGSYIEILIMLEDYASAEVAINHGLEFGIGEVLASTLKDKIQQMKTVKQQHISKVDATEFPRITTLIPAYKHEFIIETLLALTAQTYPFFQVIVSDDSPDQVITQLLANPKFAQIHQKLKLKVLQGPRQGGFSNILHLLGQCDGTNLIHILMDDDLIYPKFYEKHIEAHLQNNISVSVSYRWFCNKFGQPMWVSPVPAWVTNAQNAFMTINASQLFDSVVPQCDNWLGELSNSVFKPSAISLFARARLEDVAYYGLGDIGCLLEASLQSELGLIKEYLGGFRQHDTQFSAQQHSKAFQCGVIAWVALALGAFKAQKINANILQKVVHTTRNSLLQRYPSDAVILVIAEVLNSNDASSEQFANNFNLHWETFIQCQDWQAASSLRGKAQQALFRALT